MRNIFFRFSKGLKMPMALFVFVALFSCDKKGKEAVHETPKEHQETLVRINKYLVGKDADIIRGYIRRRNWTMNVSETGLWHMIYEKGKGPAAKTGQIATLTYKVWLLDGTLCYSSETHEPKKFRIGKGGVERGLEEGILLLHEGDKARFIMPPHLAYGLMGDDDKIPPRSIILYEVQLVQLTE